MNPRYGDEIKIASFIATISTIVQKLSITKEDGGAKPVVRYIENEKTKSVILFRQKLAYMVLTREKDDSYLFLTNIIDHLNNQVLFFEKNRLRV